jgi:hypothetical protein
VGSFLGLKWQAHEAEWLPLFSAEVKNELSNITILPVYLNGRDKDNFTFYNILYLARIFKTGAYFANESIN